MKNGYVKVCSCTPDIKVADVEFNKSSILAQVKECEKLGGEIRLNVSNNEKTEFLIKLPTAQNKTEIYSRIEEDSQATRIELAFKDFIRVLDDFISDEDQLTDEQFEQLLEAANAIHSIAVFRHGDDPCHGCDGDCIKCGKIRQSYGQEELSETE